MVTGERRQCQRISSVDHVHRGGGEGVQAGSAFTWSKRRRFHLRRTAATRRPSRRRSGGQSAHLADAADNEGRGHTSVGRARSVWVRCVDGPRRSHGVCGRSRGIGSRTPCRSRSRCNSDVAALSTVPHGREGHSKSRSPAALLGHCRAKEICRTIATARERPGRSSPPRTERLPPVAPPPNVARPP